jgi:hypothetical protein
MAEAEVPRRRIVTVIVVVASLFAFLFIFANWAKEQALDTDEWTDTSSQLLEDEEIRNTISVYLVDQLYSNVDVAAELRNSLPPEAQRLAGPLSGGLREFAERAANRALESPRVQQAWKNANRQAHETFLKIVHDDGEFVSTAGGQVTLDLHPLVEDLANEIGLAKLAAKLPPDAGQLEIMKSDQLEAAQTGANILEDLPIVLLALWLALWALAMYLAVGRRREAIKAIGLGLIIAGLAAVVLRVLAGDAVVEALANTAAVDDAADDTWSIATSLLVEITQSVIGVGVLLLIGAWLAGPTRPATTFRRAAAPYMRERPGLTFGVVAAIFLLLVILAPIRAFTQPVPLLLLTALTLMGTVALRRVTEREFPDAPMPEGGILETIRGMRSGSSGAPGRGPQDPPSSASSV